MHICQLETHLAGNGRCPGKDCHLPYLTPWVLQPQGSGKPSRIHYLIEICGTGSNIVTFRERAVVLNYLTASGRWPCRPSSTVAES